MPNFLDQRLDRIRSAGRFRELPGGVEGIDFWSNDYLGMARPQVQGEVEEAVSSPYAQAAAPPEHSTGATGSRLISGDLDFYHATERMIADFHGYEAALLYNSGYTANLGLLSSVLKRGDVILYDELVHASCRDGIRLGLAQARKFAHNDLEQMLVRTCGSKRGSGEVFVLTESRFSMDGDLAPLPHMADLCAQHGAHLIVDEAHSVGLEGPHGAGLVAQLVLQEMVFATVVTYGKAFGTHGAAVLGSGTLRDYLVNTSRPFIYTTGPSPGQWRTIAGAYARLTTEQTTRYQGLKRVIAHFKEQLAASGLAAFVPAVDGPIQTFRLPGNEAVMAAETACREAGLLVKGIRSPTVAAGSERLRICLHAFNTEEEVAALVTALRDL